MEIILATAEEMNESASPGTEIKCKSGTFDIGRLATYYPAIHTRMMEIDEATKSTEHNDWVVC